MDLTKLGRKVLTLLVALPALLFLVMGLRWLVNPAGIAPELGLTLESGLGLSSQVGDFSAFFLVAGLCVLSGLMTRIKTWYYPAVMLLAVAAVGRLVAWIVHDAALAAQMIVFEVVVASLFFTASRVLTDSQPQ